jgi:hypothetical protein
MNFKKIVEGYIHDLCEHMPGIDCGRQRRNRRYRQRSQWSHLDLSFGSCTHEKVVVDSNGTLSVENISGTTNGTVRSSGMKVTLPVTIFGSVVTATCTTENTDIGTLKGVASGSATLEVNAVINCGSFAPSMKWEDVYVATTSTGPSHAIGVTS